MWLSSRIQIQHEVLHGGLPLEKRERIIARFRHEPGPQALLVSLKAGGVGLNLPEASTVILFDRSWNPATEAQAFHRVTANTMEGGGWSNFQAPLLNARPRLHGPLLLRRSQMVHNKRDCRSQGQWEL